VAFLAKFHSRLDLGIITAQAKSFLLFKQRKLLQKYYVGEEFKLYHAKVVLK